MKKNILIIFALLASISLFSQSVGDTIVVKSLFHGSIGRDTMVNFPDNSSLTFEKIIMKYNMRCKDGKVSTGSNRNLGCGEWDYSCNTYITDSSKTDSLLSRQASYSISDFTGDTFYYTNNTVNDYYITYQTSTTVDSIISETQSVMGSGNLSLNSVLKTDEVNGKSMYLFTSSELISAGVTGGSIDGILINQSVAGINAADFLRVRMKSTTDPQLSDAQPHLTAFSEVYFKNTDFIPGNNRLQFSNPFIWNGTSNVIVEFTFTNNQTNNGVVCPGDTIAPYSFIYGLESNGDQYFNFNGSNYIEANQYKGIGGSNPRTVEAWIKTSVGGKEIVSWGRDATGEKWNFRMDGGKLRVEVNGGNKVGVTDVADNKWHHVACTFSGTNVIQTNLYVDGILEGPGSQVSQVMNTNVTGGINVRVSRGTNNRYFDGIIDEVRLWDTVLTASEIGQWMYKSIDASHPKYAHLEMYYPLNEGTGTSVADASPNQNDASIVNGNQWAKFKGIDLFKEMHGVNHRPMLTFLQGNYQTTTVIDTILDSVPNFQHSVTAYQIFSKAGTLKSDSIASTTNFYYQAGYEYIIDTNGAKIDSIYIGAQGFFGIYTMEYFRRYPSKFEIMSFVTPYGIGLNFGMGGKTWTFDLTDFSPVLKGKKRLTMEWGGQNQEEMDIQFLFIVGTPPRDVLDIDQIWKVTKPSYSSISQNLDFEPRNIQLNALGKSFKIRSAITGHGQEGEFIPRTHSVSLNNGSNTISWQVWKECGENPVYPQGGTWIYDRAGWCPGAATDLHESDISSFVTAGNSANIDYSMSLATGSSSYIVNHQLVTYGDPNFTLDAAVADILAPSPAIENSRKNYICANPRIVIQNTGSSALTSLTINYWINDAATPETFKWSGNLSFMEKEEVTLPSPERLWKAMKPDNNRFYAEVEGPNAGSDAYQYNNVMSTYFEIPAVVPSEFVIRFSTNNAANESTYFVLDEDENIVFQRTTLVNNRTYNDTMRLTPGCYQFFVNDYDGDGIDFWANSDGAGSVKFITPKNQSIKNFEPDFGRSIIFNFTIDHPLSYDEFDRLVNGYFNVYPNPATNQVTVELDHIGEKSVDVYNSAGQKLDLKSVIQGDKMVFDTDGLNPGIYVIRVISGSDVRSQKLIIQ